MAVQSNPAAIALIEISSYGASTDTLNQWANRKELDALKEATTRLVNEHSGTVMQNLGDTVLTSFARPEAALDAACEILKASIPEPGDIEEGKAGFMVSVGVAWGVIKVESGFMASAAIDHATALLDASNAGEILIDHAVYETLSERDNFKLEQTAQVANEQAWKLTCAGLDGFNPASSTIELDMDAATDQSFGAFGTTPVHLEYAGHEFDLEAGKSRFTIGRAQDNDIVVTESHVSRYHARIDRSSGGITLVNLSGNGCCYQPEGGVAQSCTDSEVLNGSGLIGLAPNFHLAGENTIKYRIG